MNIAILIDAENVVPSHADLIFNHAASLGTIVRKEIYGAATALSAWVAPVLKYAIHANLTIKAAKGKNSSDIALVIGAMDLLVVGGIDAVIIASSDSDFSALSVRLRDAGIEVIGMGTEKANELWRTACSSFTVLQAAKNAPKPQQPAPKPAQKAPKTQNAATKVQNAQKAQNGAAQQPAKSQPQPEAKPSRAARAAEATHEERVAVIRALIEKRLIGHGGRLQVSTLFPSLNQLAEYRVDKLGAGKKPLNYLISTFGEMFRFEESADGQSWVRLPDAAPAGTAPEEAAAAAEAAPVEAPETKPEAAAQPAQGDAPAGENAPEYGDEPEEEAVDPLKALVDAGMAEDVAKQIVVIFTESDSLREAYNKLRTTFGNSAGRDYYQQVKEIAGRQGKR